MVTEFDVFVLVRVTVNAALIQVQITHSWTMDISTGTRVIMNAARVCCRADAVAATVFIVFSHGCQNASLYVVCYLAMCDLCGSGRCEHNRCLVKIK